MLIYVTVEGSYVGESAAGEAAQAVAEDGLLKYSCQVKIAVLGLFANMVDKASLLREVIAEKGPATIFMALLKEPASARRDEVWHRGLYILDELSLEIKEVPTSAQVRGYRQLASQTQSAEVRNIAERLASKAEADL